MKRVYWIFSICCLAALQACENDIDLTADYKETMIVYGLLDLKQDTHYIRVNKAFLGDGNALVFAQEADSLNYDTLHMIIEKYAEGGNTPLATYVLEKTVNEIQKDTGLFASDQNVLYRLVQTLESGRVYKLTIENPNTGYAVDATTRLASNLQMDYPLTNQTLLNFEEQNPLVPNPITEISWLGAKNTGAYQLVLIFTYREYPTGNPGNFVVKTIEKPFPLIEHTQQYDIPQNVVEQGISKQDFFAFVRDNIAEDPSKARHFVQIDLKVLIAGKELWEYYEINKPSTSIVQKITAYTNVNNGFGLFSSRSSGGVNGLQLNAKTLDSLKNGQYTDLLNFE